MLYYKKSSFMKRYLPQVRDIEAAIIFWDTPTRPFYFMCPAFAGFYTFGLDPNWDGILFYVCP